MESEVYANAGDICLDTVDWTSLKKTTLNFFLSFKDVCDLPLSENYCTNWFAHMGLSTEIELT